MKNFIISTIFCVVIWGCGSPPAPTWHIQALSPQGIKQNYIVDSYITPKIVNHWSGQVEIWVKPGYYDFGNSKAGINIPSGWLIFIEEYNYGAIK